MNNGAIAIICGLMLLSVVSGAVVSKNVLDAFANGNNIVPVIVEQNQNVSIIKTATQVQQRHRFPAYISEQELRKLELNPMVDKIRMNLPIKISLAQSVGIIGANATWDLQSDGLNLSGFSQSVCILDTGIDSTHPDLAEKILAEKCYCTASDSGNGGCCPDGTVESDNATDDNGHGTHVSGIIGANGIIKGVAKDSKIVMVKIMNASGDGRSLDLENGLQWCINNSDKYNISIITASLGGAEGFNESQRSACDDDVDSVLTSEIYNAYSKNISVTIAAGNDGWTDKITWPACISYAIPVGATYKNDSLIYNRNSFVKLLGIGYNINSTWLNGKYQSESGTSMATPMVAGAILIINQYLKLVGETMSPSDIENVLQKTGKQISESGNEYSRINIYNAMLYLDSTSPDVALVSPTDDKVNLTNNQSFVCNATDWQLANITLDLWNSTDDLYRNLTKNITGTANQTDFNLNNLGKGSYYWNCLATDKNNNYAFATTNYSLVIGGVYVKLISPNAQHYTNINLTDFNCSIASDTRYDLSNVTFYLWDANGSLIYNKSNQISGSKNETSFNYTFSENENYSWNCLGLNNGSNKSYANKNFTITYDTIKPNISMQNPTLTNSKATIKWTTNEVANSSLLMNSGSWENSTNYVKNHLITVSGLSASTTYNYIAISCDRANNCKNISGHFTTKDTPRHSGKSSSSISVPPTILKPKTYKTDFEEMSKGYTRKLKAQSKINFTIFNFGGEHHLLTVNEVGKNYVNLTIESKPIRLRLMVGQSKELNLTSKNYYNLLVTLNNITNGQAELTLKLINKPIPRRIIPIHTNKIIEKKPTNISKTSWFESAFWSIISIAIILSIFTRKSKKLKSGKTSKEKDGKNKKVKT